MILMMYHKGRKLREIKVKKFECCFRFEFMWRTLSLIHTWWINSLVQWIWLQLFLILYDNQWIVVYLSLKRSIWIIHC